MGRDNARTGTTRQADAGDMAFGNVAARLLAVGTSGRSEGEGTSAGRFPQGSGYRDRVASVGKNPAVCSRGSVRGYHISRAISWGRCAHIHRRSYCASAFERACVVCKILAAHVLAE